MEYGEVTKEKVKEEVDKLYKDKDRNITLHCLNKASYDMFNKALMDAGVAKLGPEKVFGDIVESIELPAPYTIQRVEPQNPHRGVVQVSKYGAVLFTCYIEFSALFKSSNPFELFSRYVKQNIKTQEYKQGSKPNRILDEYPQHN